MYSGWKHTIQCYSTTIVHRAPGRWPYKNRKNKYTEMNWFLKSILTYCKQISKIYELWKYLVKDPEMRTGHLGPERHTVEEKQSWNRQAAKTHFCPTGLETFREGELEMTVGAPQTRIQKYTWIELCSKVHIHQYKTLSTSPWDFLKVPSGRLPLGAVWGMHVSTSVRAHRKMSGKFYFAEWVNEINPWLRRKFS